MDAKNTIKKPSGRILGSNGWETFVNISIIVWLAIFTLSTFHDMELWIERVVDTLNYVIVCLFFVEYVIRIIVAKNKKSYLFSFMGITDFFVCIPFFALFFGLNWSLIDILRIVRILSLFELGKKYQKPFADLKNVFHLVKHEFIVFVSIMGGLMYITSIGIYYAEHEAQPEKFASFGDGLWFAIVTLSTTGYGYLYPITPAGRIFTGCIIFIAMLSIASSMGMITSAFASVRNNGKSTISASKFKQMLEDEIARKKSDIEGLEDIDHDVTLSLNDIRSIFKKYDN